MCHHGLADVAFRVEEEDVEFWGEEAGNQGVGGEGDGNC